MDNGPILNLEGSAEQAKDWYLYNQECMKAFAQVRNKVRYELEKNHKVEGVNNIELLRQYIKDVKDTLYKVRKSLGLPDLDDDRNVLPPVSVDVVIEDFYEKSKSLATSAAGIFSFPNSSPNMVVKYDEQKHEKFLREAAEFESLLDFLTYNQKV